MTDTLRHHSTTSRQ